MRPQQTVEVTIETSGSAPAFYIYEELTRGHKSLIYKGYLPTFAFSDPDRMERLIANTRDFIEAGRKLVIDSLGDQGSQN